MGTETDTSPSHWNVDTLKEYFSTALNDFKGYHTELRKADAERFQQRFIALEKAFTDNLAAAERAVLKAEAAAEKRFEAVNEFRGTLSDQSATLLTRKEADARLDGLGDKLNTLGARLDRSEGSDKGVRDARADGHMTVGSVVGIVGGIVGMLSLVVLAFGTFGHQTSVPITAPIGLVGADTKRVDDVISRLDAISARINGLSAPIPTPVR